MKIISKVEHSRYDLIQVKYDDGTVQELKRMTNGDWINSSGAYLTPTSGLEALFHDWNNPNILTDNYRDKVILEISLKLLENGDGDFLNRLKSVVDAIMEYRNENNM